MTDFQSMASAQIKSLGLTQDPSDLPALTPGQTLGMTNPPGFKVCWINTNGRAYVCAADASARAACNCDYWTAPSPPVPAYSRAVACRGLVWPVDCVVLRQRALVRIAR